MIRHLRIILVIMFIFIYTLNIDNTYASDRMEKSILIVGSHDEYCGWKDYILEGFLSEIEKLKSNLDLNIYVEKMNATKKFSQEYLDAYRKNISNKYDHNEIDVIVAIEGKSFEHILANRKNKESILYKKKILLVGTNANVDLTQEEKKYITIIEDASDVKNLNLITDLHEDVETINVVLNDSDAKDNYIENAEISKLFLDREININYIVGNTVDSVEKQIKNISKENQAYIINGIFFDDDKYRTLDLTNIINTVKKYSNSPIYTTIASYLDEDVIGGYIHDGKELGLYAARELIRIIDNRTLLEDTTKIELGYTPILNYEQLIKNNIDLGKIPSATDIINKPKYVLLLSNEEKKFIYREITIFIIILIIGVISSFFIKKKIGNLNRIKELNKIALEREKMQTDFIVNVSHEFRTPLNVIQSITKVTEMKINMNSVDNEYLIDKLNQINKNSNRLLKLVNDLIDINRFEIGNYNIILENLNIVQVIEDITMATVDYASAKNIELIFDTEEEEIISAIDKEKIERLLLNLLSNAIKYTNENGHIKVNIRLNDKNVIISVCDDGIGISKDKQNKIFTRFYQAGEILKRIEEGSGIGLCIVEEIIIMHRGNIKVESEENKGSKFEVILPIYKVDVSNENKMISDINQSVKIAMSDILDTK